MSFRVELLEISDLMRDTKYDEAMGRIESILEAIQKQAIKNRNRLDARATYEQGKLLNFKGEILVKTGSLEEAEQILTKSASLIGSDDDLIMMKAENDIILSQLEAKREHPDKAIEFLRSASNKFASVNRPELCLDILNDIYHGYAWSMSIIERIQLFHEMQNYCHKKSNMNHGFFHAKYLEGQIYSTIGDGKAHKTLQETYDGFKKMKSIKDLALVVLEQLRVDLQKLDLQSMEKRLSEAHELTDDTHVEQENYITLIYESFLLYLLGKTADGDKLAVEGYQFVEQPDDVMAYIWFNHAEVILLSQNDAQRLDNGLNYAKSAYEMFQRDNNNDMRLVCLVIISLFNVLLKNPTDAKNNMLLQKRIKVSDAEVVTSRFAAMVDEISTGFGGFKERMISLKPRYSKDKSFFAVILHYMGIMMTLDDRKLGLEFIEESASLMSKLGEKYLHIAEIMRARSTMV
ncbi:MAG: hypothetical protein OEZ01_06335 [Candidatus Heimdallarchaeota archaeon]|nr:hypothetical protein [Candidatus Heimdallarchaeota archaeon]MDH5645606.1 hypothetical protein [Candidatus Heimdallarchaeota archaeon]